MRSGANVPTPLLSLVVPTYGVALYLPDFLASLDAQRLDVADLTDVELVFVDDGSLDGSGDLVAAWAEGSSYAVRLVRQENQGLAAARNRGLDLATGSWLSFPDPDDVLGAGYLALVLGRLRTLDEDVPLAVARLLLLDADGTVSDTHPLHARFDGGSRVVDLLDEPEVIHLQAASGFFRRHLLESLGLRFDGDVRPNFEDAFLTAHYLAAQPRPVLALVAEAHYVYRRRADGTSLVQQSWGRREKYTLLPRVGYLRLLEDLAAEGPVPAWAQNLVLYDLLFYFREDQRMHAATAGLDDETRSTFHDLVHAILRHVDPVVLAGFDVIPTSWVLRQGLRVGYQEPGHVPDRLHLWRVDAARQIVQVRYVHGSRAPVERFTAGGRQVEPVHAKVRDLVWFGRVLAHQRIVWLPATAPLRAWLDGSPVPLVVGAPEEHLRVGVEDLWQGLTGHEAPARSGRLRVSTEGAAPEPGPVGAAAPRRGRSGFRRRVSRWRGRLRRRLAARRPPSAPESAAVTPVDPDATLRKQARSREARATYGRAWVFMDRDTMAQDNAEHLYRWVREHHPEVNAWFSLSPRSADWGRLEAEGFRLVDPQSDVYVMLVLNAERRISSQADHYVVQPVDRERFGAPRGRFAWLQHGVIKDDLSRWLNGKPIGLFVTTTPDEYASVAGDHSPYVFTSKEVVLTGQPRHDRLLELARGRPRPRRVLVAPTWRRDLLGEAGTGNDRQLREGFWDSDYMRGWLRLLDSPELRRWACDHDLTLCFLPHPNLDAHITDGLPDHVELLRYAGSDVQEVLAGTALMITDYSSLAFEQAYLGRPVLYWQTDGGDIFAGGHIGRRGSWSYVDDGFGPVCGTLEEVGAALGRLSGSPDGPVAEAVYAERMAAAFPFRDGRCCARVFERIVAMTEPEPASVALAADPPGAPVQPYVHLAAGSAP